MGAVHAGGFGLVFAHLAQMHSLVFPRELVRLVNLRITSLAQIGIVVVAEHHSRSRVTQGTRHHAPTRGVDATNAPKRVADEGRESA